MFGKKIKSSVIKDGVYRYNDVYLKYIQVIRTYRECLAELDDVDHINKTGVYILLGTNDYGQNMVYVGKAGNVIKRINQHKVDKDKEFFNELFMVTTNDDSFGDSYASYLENMIYNRFTISANIIVQNDVIPTKGNLSEDEAEYCENVGDTIISIISQAASGRFLVTQFGKSEHSKFYLKSKNYELIATYVEGKLLVHKDSKVSRKISNECAAYVKRDREELIEAGILIEYKDQLIVGKDYTFDNVNKATNILAGATVGKADTLWKNYSGLTLKEYIDNGTNNG